MCPMLKLYDLKQDVEVLPTNLYILHDISFVTKLLQYFHDYIP